MENVAHLAEEVFGLHETALLTRSGSLSSFVLYRRSRLMTVLEFAVANDVPSPCGRVPEMSSTYRYVPQKPTCVTARS